MEYKDVFASFAVVLLCVVGFLGFINYWNDEYGTGVGGEFNQTMARVELFTNLTDLSGDVGENTIAEDGSAPGDSDTNFARRALSTLTLLPRMIGIGESVMQDAADILGVSDTIVNVGIMVFMFAFALTFAYILILGIKQLV